jgi:low temperature requirement protein LtrA
MLAIILSDLILIWHHPGESDSVENGVIPFVLFLAAHHNNVVDVDNLYLSESVSVTTVIIYGKIINKSKLFVSTSATSSEPCLGYSIIRGITSLLFYFHVTVLLRSAVRLNEPTKEIANTQYFCG